MLPGRFVSEVEGPGGSINTNKIQSMRPGFGGLLVFGLKYKSHMSINTYTVTI